jgi:anti-sigma factor RsiW
MKVIEAEVTGPVEGEDAVVTPPRPLHRRVSVSLLLTLSVLIGTVVTIYTVFPARHNVLMAEAIARHRESNPAWDLAAPGQPELHAWAIGVVGRGVPLPPAGLPVIGARRVELLHRPVAVVRVKVGDDEITYAVQHSRSASPEPGDRVDGELRAVSWRQGTFSCVAVGPEKTAKTCTHTRLVPPSSVNAPGTTTRLPHARCAGASG